MSKSSAAGRSRSVVTAAPSEPTAYTPGIELNIREHLESLADRLHLHEGRDRDRADELHGEVTEALETEDHHSLMDGLEHQAVAFEDTHPDLAALIRRVSDVLSASGI